MATHNQSLMLVQIFASTFHHPFCPLSLNDKWFWLKNAADGYSLSSQG